LTKGRERKRGGTQRGGRGKGPILVPRAVLADNRKRFKGAAGGRHTTKRDKGRNSPALWKMGQR